MNHFTQCDTTVGSRLTSDGRERARVTPSGVRDESLHQLLGDCGPRRPHPAPFIPPHPSQPVTPHPSPRNPPDTDQFTASLCAVPPRRTHASSLNAESRRLTLHKEVPQNNELHLNIGRNTLQRFTEEIETIIASPYEFWKKYIK